MHVNEPSFAQFGELDLALANQLAKRESFEKELKFKFRTTTAKHLRIIVNETYRIPVRVLVQQ